MINKYNRATYLAADFLLIDLYTHLQRSPKQWLWGWWQTQNPQNTQLGLASISSGVFRSLWLCLSFGKYLSLIFSPWVSVERWDSPPPLFSGTTQSKARPPNSLKEGEKECVHNTLQGDSVLVLGLGMLIMGDVCPTQLLRGENWGPKVTGVTLQSPSESEWSQWKVRLTGRGTNGWCPDTSAPGSAWNQWN